MRITGGRARGIPLVSPKGQQVRPAMDRVRQAVFSSLGPRVEGARFLDLFAGSGSYGLEALSRGATEGVFVEQDRRALESLRDNLARVCASAGRQPSECRIVPSEVVRWVRQASGKFDLVFIDPPYEGIERTAEDLFEGCAGLVAPDGLLLFEMPGELALQPPGWDLVKRLGSGRHQATVAFFARKARAGSGE